MPKDKFDEPAEELPRRKWWIRPLLLMLVLAISGFASFKIYRRVEPDRLARRAKEMTKAGDFHGAALTLARALQINSNNAAAARGMAELMERMQMPQAMDWRRRLVQLNPGSLPDALSWADLALREGKTAMAVHALETVPAEARGSAEWQSKAGLAAIRSGRWQTAREHFLEACRLEPKNDMHRYNLALIRTQSTDAAERAEGFAALNQPDLQGRVRVFAQRAAIAQLLREKRDEEALATSTALVASPDAETIDFTVQLDLMEKFKRDSAGVLSAAQQRAGESGPEAATLMQWLRLRSKAEEALTWAQQLPKAIAATPAVQAARGECLFALSRWVELNEVAGKANWGPANARRLALLSRAAAELGDPAQSDHLWTDAVRVSGTDRSELSQLAALASGWGWKRQMREAMWAAANSLSPDWALKILHSSYLADGETANLLRVARRQAEYNPKDIRARNNAALCQLLTEMDVQGALRDAGQLTLEAPEDPILRSTYAFALLINRRARAALAEIEKIPAQKLEEPTLALYYGLIQSAVGGHERARELLQISEKAPVLPEEKKLREAALKRASEQSPKA